ncbi:MAG TPA: protein translocase subunit SecF [Ignavibacteria bacterium]|nr:protein translocase subunit SecF [Ignavibacteria bacterium]
MRLFKQTNIDFLGKRKIFYLVSIIFIVVGMTVLFIKGIPLGIDFLGGTEIQVKFDNPIEVGELRNSMDKAGFVGMEIKSMGSAADYLLRTPLQGEGQTVADKIQAGIKENMPGKNYQVLQVNKVGPKIGAELRKNAIYAVVFSLLGILIYLALRFQFVYALGAVIGLFHDVLITISAVAIFDAVFPMLQLEFNQQMLAAFLTLIGFSVNDTVIIFDRIRENIKLFKNEDIEDVMNKSVNATLSRTIITSGTVFLTVLVLFLFGGEVLRAFAFTFAVGVITGTYSSVFVSSSIVVDWRHHVLGDKHKGRIAVNTTKS